MVLKKSKEVAKSTKSSGSPKLKKGAAAKARKAISGGDGSAVVKVRDSSPTDTIYLGHIPKGFGETEMRKFFAQFGDVVKLKLFRSKKTKGSKGYAFVKFESVDTAKTVSESMNGYFLGDRQLTSEVVPKWKVHKGMFLQPRKHKEGEEETAVVAKDTDTSKGALKASSSLKKKQAKLKALGIDYDFLDAVGSNGGPESDEEEQEKPTAKKEAKGSSSASKKRKVAPVAAEEKGAIKTKKKKAAKAAPAPAHAPAPTTRTTRSRK